MPSLGECTRDAHGLQVLSVGCPTCLEQRWVRLTKYDHRSVRTCALCNRNEMRRRSKIGKAYESTI